MSNLVVTKEAHAFLCGVVIGILYAVAFHSRPDKAES